MDGEDEYFHDGIGEHINGGAAEPTELDPIQVTEEENQDNDEVRSGKYCDQSTLLLMSNEQKQVALNKVVGEIKLHVVMKKNSCIDEKIDSLRQKIALEEKQAEQVTRNMSLELHEVNQLENKAVNTLEITRTINEVFQNMVKRTNIKKETAEIVEGVATVKTLIQENKDLRSELKELQNSIAEGINKPTIDIDPDIIKENLRLKQENMLKTQQLNELSSETETLEAFVVNNDKLRARLIELTQEINSRAASVEEKTKICEERKETLTKQEETLKLRLSETVKEEQKVVEDYDEMLKSVAASKSTLSKLSEQFAMCERDVEHIKGVYEETKEQCCVEEVMCQKRSAASKQNLLVVQNKYEDHVKQRKDLESENHGLKEEYASLVGVKYSSTVKNLQTQTLLSNQECVYEKTKPKNILIAERLQKVLNDLHEKRSKTEAIYARISTEKGLIEIMKPDFEDKLKVQQTNNEVLENELQARIDYLAVSKDYLDQKVNDSNKFLNEMRAKTEQILDKMDTQKIVLESSSQTFEFLKKKLENDKEALNNKMKENIAANAPTGILKPTKTPPKKVRFEGFSSTNSSASDGNEKSEDAFDKLLQSSQIVNISTSETVPSKKRKNEW